jgi:2-dehydro-3-deoxy-D-arabinonate dehydratase
MLLARYHSRHERTAGVGVLFDDGLRPLPYASLADMLRNPVASIRVAVEQATAAPPLDGDLDYNPPVDGRMEVWASGVTYRRSREARMEESETADVYSRVYSAERPELFFKSVPWRVVGDGDAIGIRTDSALNVPEPELAVVANALGEPVGYTICNDVSSRSIEGANPLYLPQAKVYAGSCALFSGIRPVWETPDLTALTIQCSVRRDAALVWTAGTDAGELTRSPESLLSWLFRQDSYPDGVVLSTGTGIVPDMDFTLRPGDIVAISIAGIGTLTNTVREGVEPFRSLSEHVQGEERVAGQHRD